MEMEKPCKKRAREDDDLEDRQESSKKNAGKKQDLKGSDFNENNDEGSNVKALDSSLALDIGVFDFPWLKDGMISNSDDWRFEDVFSSSLIYDKPTTSALEFSGQCLYESPEALLNFSEDKFDDTLSRPVPKGNGLETEGVDKSIWSSLLSQPLQHGGTI
ncbi:hypothetical protein CJ030_MR2G024062 [Morella rubra]|uniref:Uncharacterized protein n=1 Tax=Morella rubra TaxID=262757 RepID=A0A6A1W8P7_9ROSI|nr:hypothetical protein CJ030_MR2G024062 [Morella rubra]